MAQRKQESARRLNVAVKVLWVGLLLLDLLLVAIGIAVLLRGSFAGALLGLPVAILTRFLIRGSPLLRSARRRNEP
jgi:hypothetical protein